MANKKGKPAKAVKPPKAGVPEIHWLEAPEPHNYPAAASYLSLTYPPARVSALVTALKRAPVTSFKSKDVFRASGLSLLGVSNAHVDKDQRKIRKGVALSPILLVRSPETGRVIIADGYHRMCAIYSFHEDALIHCKIV